MPIRLAAFTKNGVNPNYQAFLHGVQRAAAACDAITTCHFPETPDDPVEQTARLRRVIAERPNAIIFAPADDCLLEGPIAEANAAGIPLVGFVNRMKGNFVTFVGADDAAMGRTIACVLIEALGRQGDIVLIEGPETAPTSRDRGRGFREALATSPGIRLLGTAPGRYLRAPGAEAMARLLALHSRIDGVICTNDLMALGALDALEAAGRAAIVVGINGTIEAAKEVSRGRLLATLDYDGFKMGAVTAMAAVRHLSGRTLPREILLPAQVIHSGNYPAWLIPIEQRPLPDWDVMVPS